jgi:hypothetical protein
VPTLVASGGKSPAWVRAAAAQLAAILPNAQEQTLAGQTHYVKSDAPAPVLSEFFRGRTSALPTPAAEPTAHSAPRP